MSLVSIPRYYVRSQVDKVPINYRLAVDTSYQSQMVEACPHQTLSMHRMTSHMDVCQYI